MTTVEAVQSLHLDGLPKEIDVAYDIESRDVLDSLYMTRRCGWEIHAFEPNPDQSKECRLGAAMSDKINLHELAVMDSDGTTSFNRCTEHMDQIRYSFIKYVAPNPRFFDWNFAIPRGGYIQLRFHARELTR